MYSLHTCGLIIPKYNKLWIIWLNTSGVVLSTFVWLLLFRMLAWWGSIAETRLIAALRGSNCVVTVLRYWRLMIKDHNLENIWPHKKLQMDFYSSFNDTCKIWKHLRCLSIRINWFIQTLDYSALKRSKLLWHEITLRNLLINVCMHVC